MLSIKNYFSIFLSFPMMFLMACDHDVVVDAPTEEDDIVCENGGTPPGCDVPDPVAPDPVMPDPMPPTPPPSGPTIVTPPTPPPSPTVELPPTSTPTPPISNITECKNLDETEESRTGFPDGRGSDNNGRESRAEDGDDLDDLDGWDGAIQHHEDQDYITFEVDDPGTIATINITSEGPAAVPLAAEFIYYPESDTNPEDYVFRRILRSVAARKNASLETERQIFFPYSGRYYIRIYDEMSNDNQSAFDNDAAVFCYTIDVSNIDDGNGIDVDDDELSWPKNNRAIDTTHDITSNGIIPIYEISSTSSEFLPLALYLSATASNNDNNDERVLPDVDTILIVWDPEEQVIIRKHDNVAQNRTIKDDDPIETIQDSILNSNSSLGMFSNGQDDKDYWIILDHYSISNLGSDDLETDVTIEASYPETDSTNETLELTQERPIQYVLLDSNDSSDFIPGNQINVEIDYYDDNIDSDDRDFDDNEIQARQLDVLTIGAAPHKTFKSYRSTLIAQGDYEEGIIDETNIPLINAHTLVQIGPPENPRDIDVRDTEELEGEFDITVTVASDQCGTIATDEQPIADDLVINEVFWNFTNVSASDANGNGIVEEIGDQFIELLNVSGKTLNLGGLSIETSVDSASSITRATIPCGTTLAHGKPLTIFGVNDSVNTSDNIIMANVDSTCTATTQNLSTNDERPASLCLTGAAGEIIELTGQDASNNRIVINDLAFGTTSGTRIGLRAVASDALNTNESYIRCNTSTANASTATSAECDAAVKDTATGANIKYFSHDSAITDSSHNYSPGTNVDQSNF